MDSNFEEQIINKMEYEMKRSYISKNKQAIIVKGPDGVTQYCCVECPVRCLEKAKMEKHLLVHFDEYRFLCGICGTGLKRKEHLDRHTMEHLEYRPHVCEDCGKGFKRKEHLNIHRTIHSGDKSQTCPLCGKAFYRKDHLIKHQQTHKVFIDNSVDQELMAIKEEVMDESGRDEESMMEIQKSHDSTMEMIMNSSHIVSNDTERPYACCVCNKTYKRKDHLKMHSLSHLKKDIVCSECGQIFKKEEHLLTHMKIHLNIYVVDSSEEDNKLPILVDEQMNTDMFSSDNSLLVAKSHKKKSDRPHECDICHRKFKRKQHLKVHMNVHVKITQPSIWCSLCNEGFYSNRDFENHRCTAESPGQDDVSEYCDKERVNNTPQEAKKENKYPLEFVQVDLEDESDQERALPQYMLQEREIPTPQRVFVCKYCSKPFKRKDHYKIHLHVHTGVKSIFCPDCGKGFYRKDHLQKHAQVHSKPKPVPTIKPKPKKELPDLYPIKIMQSMPKKKEIKPEITIHAPSNTKLRVPLQIKVPYQMVMSMDNGEQRAVTVDPTCSDVCEDSS